MSWCHIYYITSVILYIYSGYVTASEYYVSVAPNGEDCPSGDLPCQDLSYYIADYPSYFTDDTIFYFLEGTHTLQGILNISNVSNITLQGLGHIEQGFHETVMQSTSVISCSDSNNTGILFSSSSDVVLNSLTIANCGFDNYISDQESSNNPCGYYWYYRYYLYQRHKVSLLFLDINSVTLEYVSVQNSSGNGLVLVNVYDVLIDNSSFTNNGGLETFSGNVLIVYNDQFNRLSKVIILKSTFTLGLGYGIYLWYGNDNEADIIIENSMFSNNNGQYGGGVDVNLRGGGSIEFSNCNIYNNTAWSGGGLDIYSYGNGSIEFSNCTIYNNTAWSGGGLDIYSYGNGSIEFSNCTIYNNTALYWGGGVEFTLRGNGSIELSSCIIFNNTAWSGGGVEFTLRGNGSIELSSCIIFNNTARYDGGGLDIYMRGNGSIGFSYCTICNNTARYDGGGLDIYSYENGSIAFSKCIIYNNTAKYGGGGGVFVRSYTGSVNIIFFNSIIYKNTAQDDGGGVYIRFYLESANITFINCTIYYNNARYYGGGVSTYLYGERGSSKFSNCTISNNTASFASGLVLRSLQETSTNSFHITNVSFHFNKVINDPDVYENRYRSAVVLININNVTFEEIDVRNHNTTGLVGVNSLITFDGHNIFVNNSGIYGGGIALYDFSQLLLNQNANLSFIYNHASESGGGIFVSQVLIVDNTTDCSFKVIPYHYANDTKTVLYFVNNTADISGDVLYGGKIDDCTNTLYFDHLFNYTQQTGLLLISSDPIQVCFCESYKPNCSIKDISIFAIPGINVNVSLATVGLKDTLTEGVIKLNLSDNSSIVHYNNNRLNAVCTNVTFTLRINPSLNTTEVYVTLHNSISEPFDDPYSKVIEITIDSCPNGYPFRNGTCVCRSELNLPTITCDNKTLIITRDGDMWIGYENESYCLIIYRNCPFDYCNENNISFTLNYHNKQCLHNRSGILCGQCAKGFSLMLGSNQCGQCTNDHIALIIPFALAGIALVAFVIVLNLTVSVGTINGLIFYANVVKIYEPIFFPEGSVVFLSWFISWLNLDLGINTCFYHNMDSCSKAWLQFVFPAYIWLILILIIILLRYSSKVVRLVGRQIIPVLATMILLSYTKLIRTVVQALYLIEIPCSDGMKNVTLLRWYFDANVQYVRGCHIPLFLFSLAVLTLLIVPYTLYLLTIPLFEGPLSKYMCCCKKFSSYMKPFFDAYGGPYKDNCRFWTGFLLLIRVILALVVSLVTKETITLNVLTSILIIIVFMYIILKGIYRNFLLDYLETFLILNLMFMAYMNAETSNDNDESKGQVSSIVVVSISFVVFCGIIVYHVWERLMFYNVWDHLFKSHWHQQITKVKKILNKPPPPSTSNDMELPLIDSGSSDVERRSISMSVVTVEMKRESILFDQDD